MTKQIFLIFMLSLSTSLTCLASEIPAGEPGPSDPVQDGEGSTAGEDGWKSINGIDLHIGQEGSNPRFLGVMGGVLYFVADTGQGDRLWRSDGTPVGTYQIGSLRPIVNTIDIYGGLVRNWALYFAADNGQTGVELYRLSAATEETILLRDISPGPSSSTPRFFQLYNGDVYFVAEDPWAGDQIWKTSGTANSTEQVSAIGSFSGPGSPQMFLSTIYEMTKHSATNSLFFTAYAPNYGHELWRSNGTTAGTAMVKDINPGSADGFLQPQFGGRKLPQQDLVGPFLFTATTTSNGAQPWVSNGFAAGTHMININPSGDSYPNSYASADGKTFFIASDSGFSFKVWRYNPLTLSAAPLLIDPPPAFPDLVTRLTSANNVLYFLYGLGNGEELWRSDTSHGIAFPLTYINPEARAEISGVTNMGSHLYFSAYNNTVGQEIWRSDGEFSEQVTNEESERWGSLPYFQSLARVGCHLVFAGYHGGSDSLGNELGVVEDVCFCGDGVQDPGEDCDDGNYNEQDGCNTLCQSHRCPLDQLICPDGSLGVRDPLTCAWYPCPEPSCGDTMCNGSETCESCVYDCGECTGGGGNSGLPNKLGKKVFVQ